MNMEEVRANLAAIVERAMSGEASPQQAERAPFTGSIDMTSRQEPATCHTCGNGFTANVMLNRGIVILKTINCPTCCKAWEDKNNPDPRTVEAMREASWLKLCPGEYHDTDEARVRKEAGDAITNEILGWQGDNGMGIIGSTGRCKTRLMFLYLKKRHMLGTQVRYINAVKFADELADAYGRGSHDAERWMKEIERVPVLFIDDLGKEKLTERVETFYYRCTEYRYSERLPLFFTSNLTGAKLQARWDDVANRNGFWADRAAPIIRRIRERCKSFTL